MPTAPVHQQPVIFLAFANDRGDGAQYLRNLGEEARRLQQTLEQSARAGLCELAVRQNATVEDILDLFQSAAYRNRIALFHFGGHANGYQLFFENKAGALATAYAEGLAAFLGQQRSLRLVFLNGCSTRDQARNLLAANIDVVIATDRDTEDEVALCFADRFYRGLASGATIETAFREAQAAAQLLLNAQPTAGWPWGLYVRPGDEAKLQWRLGPEPVAAPAPELEPPAPLPAVANPYRGLEYFDVQHAENYFGRAAMVEKLLGKLQETNFVAVVGSSGSGKSSLVRAGLVTALQASQLPGSRAWQVEIVRPGDDPLRALATSLVNRIGPALTPVDRIKEVRKLAAGLQDGTLPIGDVLAEVRAQHPGLARLLLVFDQFEETFTLCSDEALRRRFLQTLPLMADTPWLTVLFTLRADFYGHVLADEPFGKRVDAAPPSSSRRSTPVAASRRGWCSASSTTLRPNRANCPCSNLP